MPKFKVTFTKTTTELFLVEAEDWESAEDIVNFSDIKPYHTSGWGNGEGTFDTEEVDESP